MAKGKLPILITPRSNAAYSWLAKKDTKFDKEGTYKVTCVIDKENPGPGRTNFGNTEVSGEDWIAGLLALCKEHGVASKVGAEGCPIKDGDDLKDKEGNPKPEFAGKYLITFKTGYTPSLIDTKGNALPSSVPIYSGDIIKVAFQPQVREVKGTSYMSTYIHKVMLIEKTTGNSDMFGEEEGYEVSRQDADNGGDTPDADFGDTGNDGDF